MKLKNRGKTTLVEKREEMRKVSSLDLEGYTFLNIDKFKKSVTNKKDYVFELKKLIEGIERDEALYYEVDKGRKTKKIFYTLLNVDGYKKVLFN